LPATVLPQDRHPKTKTGNPSLPMRHSCASGYLIISAGAWGTGNLEHKEFI
jgi:hypothetical protein